MFNVLVATCNNPAFCAPDVSDEAARYRVTPASGDPYQYIRSGSYAKILCKIGGVQGEIDCNPKNKAD